MGMPTASYTLASIRSISNYRQSNFDSDEYLKRLIRLTSDINTSDWLAPDVYIPSASRLTMTTTALARYAVSLPVRKFQRDTDPESSAITAGTRSSGIARLRSQDIKSDSVRCTRELPKCGECKPWPVPCNYSRDIPDTGTSSTTTAPLANAKRPNDVQLRLQNIEKAIRDLTDVVNKAVVTINTSRKEETSVHATSAESNDQSSRLYVGKHNSFSVLEDAQNSVQKATGSLSSSLHHNASNELQFLSTSLTTTVTDNQLRGNSFYIPSKAQGYQLIGKFLESVCLGDAFFTAPSEELVLQVIFKPEGVSRKAWIVYINYMILAMLSEDQSREAKGFRHNVEIALNDSKIFLEPHLVHLQTLILLAIHGEDYASPSLSWMLVGHACRQAEALGLHLSNGSDSETHQRRLSLFWMLFAVDKSCSLAFGRPCFLPSTTYAKVALPDLGHLARFQPRSDSADGRAKSSIFGAHMFLARMELARLEGDVLHLVNSEVLGTSRNQLRENLTEWHTRTNQVLHNIFNTERASSSPNQLREMSLGISTINFEYLHVFMVLSRADASSAASRYEAARDAISLLPSLVSNWTSIYNPMTWHLLYFPFIPFFVIFEDLVQGRASTTRTAKQHDIELLAATVSYYSSLRDQFQLLAPLCERLKNVAHVFHRLAVSIVGSSGTLKQDKELLQPIPNSGISHISTLDNNAVMDFEEFQAALGNEIGVNIRQYLEWLPTDILSIPSGSLRDVSSGDITEETFNNFPTGVQEEGPRGTKRPFDVMFDWFAWDS
ncbi:hypothetical protein FCULG_00007727 [Fusarium culmorum]|uniref:Xylanolytic transcriptional activator regulatory domain-containing protein n=1 Tax=Fusarium culmorum TaxID=5516 RepID=A0A2T4H4L1_FUSCU|nr:hypothetical protein FCULG_00007727 [Fusarium culmorum]